MSTKLYTCHLGPGAAPAQEPLSPEKLQSMVERLERKIVQESAPTLASIKPSNMFTVLFSDACDCLNCGNASCLSVQRSAFSRAFQLLRARLRDKGVSMRVLTVRERDVLLLVYRRNLVAQALAAPASARYLRQLAYPLPQAAATTQEYARFVSSCIDELARRIRLADCAQGIPKRQLFPHEVGLFLGYLAQDVFAFIEHGGKDFMCNGCWKGYGDACAAQACFEQYKRCTAAFKRLHEAGTPLETLAEPESFELVA